MCGAMICVLLSVGVRVEAADCQTLVRQSLTWGHCSGSETALTWGAIVS